MVDLVKVDPVKNLFSWPRWFDDFDDYSQRGLKIRETDKDIVAEAVVAGVPADDIEVNIEDGVLTIKAEKSEEKVKRDESSKTFYQYYYTAALSGGQWDKASAEVENGVLKLVIPKTEASRPKKIAVKAVGK
jgi:HSP20 family protein